MAVIATGNHPKFLWPGIKGIFGAKYDEHDRQYGKLFDMKTSNKAYEEYVQTTGFGLTPIKPEGSPTVYDSHTQGFTQRFTNVAYSLGFIVTREEMADSQYKQVASERASSLAFSGSQTRENVGANVYNRVTNSTYLGGDGVVLGSTSHPTVSGNQSNILSTAADLSEAAIEDLAIQIRNATDFKGLKINVRPKCLIVPTASVFEANRIMKANLRVATADNDPNALKLLGEIPEIVVNNYLTDSDAWFIRTNVEKGMMWFDREATEFTNDSDYDTDNIKHKLYMRFVAGWGDWKGVYSSEGA